MAHPQRIDEAFERDLPPRADRLKQVAHRRFAVALHLFELERRIALLKREDIGRLFDPALLEEKIDLLVTEPLDVEGTARDEKLQVLGLLERAGKLAGAAEPHPLLARRVELAHDVGMQRAWAMRGKPIRLGVLRT